MTLTREQVLEMGAGREMDVLVMEKIFNAKQKYYGEEEVWYHYDRNGQPDYEWPFHNSPSTDRSAAWEVVEKLHENRFLFDISTSVGAGYTARFYNRDTEVYHNAHYIESAPLAICRAALLTTIGEGTE